MSKIAVMLISTILVLSLGYVIPTITQSLLPIRENAYAQYISQDSNNTSNAGTLSSLHPEPDASPIAAVIIIGTDMQGNTSYVPNNITMKVGQEIFVLNNDTKFQSMTNGMGPDDPLSGKLFDTGPIPPKGFAEYVASNLGPGMYAFYSTNSTSTKGVLTLEPNS